MNIVLKLKWNSNVLHFPEHFLFDFLENEKEKKLSQFTFNIFANN